MSALHDALTEYLVARRVLGTRLAWPESALRNFVDFVEAEDAAYLSMQIAMRWALRPVGVQQATHARRLSIVRGFATWLQAVDVRTQVPPPGLLPARQRRPVPHIYTERQIAGLMVAANQLRSSSGLRAATFDVLIGLLAATGLRPGEARALDVGDVDLVEAVLTIRDSKFGKSRFVPLEQSARNALATYATFRDKTLPLRATSAFLVTARGTRLKACATRRTFVGLCQTVGLRTPQRCHSGRGPRLQDLRHTFATRRLIEWYRAGLDVNRLMPRLTTYLGHASTVATYWYIQAVPELLRLAAERTEVASEGDRR
jgi:site-specific recombinase XerD